MNSFEERLTKWIDGELDGPELTEFERELDANPERRAEALAVQKMGEALRGQVVVPPMDNPDFFNHQVMERILKETDSALPAEHASPGVFDWLRGVPRIAWAGAFCLLMAFGLFQSIIPTVSVGGGSGTFVRSLSSQQSDVWVSEFSGKDNKYAVVWIDGLDYLPGDYRIQ